MGKTDSPHPEKVCGGGGGSIYIGYQARIAFLMRFNKK